MGYVAAGVALATTAASIAEAEHQASVKKKAAADAAKLAAGGAAGATGGDFGKSFGKVPEAAPYHPVDIRQEQLNTILDDRAALPGASDLIKQSNNMVTKDALRRITKLVPGYLDSMAKYGAATNSLLSGELPFEDVLGIVRNRADIGGSIGTPGTAGNATLRDLGLSRLDAIKTGGGLLSDMVNIAERVSPRASYLVPKDLLISPFDRVKVALEQNQLLQQSGQNAANLAATGDPAARAELEARIAAGGARGVGGASGGSAATAAAIAAAPQLANSLASWYTKSAGGGGYDSNGLNSAGYYKSEAAALAGGGAGSTASYYGGAGGPNPSAGYYISGQS